jgi:hypothetical protein
MRIGHVAAAGALCILLSGCAVASNRVDATAPINWTGQTKRVVLVDPDVELSELDAGGTNEPRADWTATAKDFIDQDIRADLSTRAIDMVETHAITDPHEVQLVKLHNAVGSAILLHLYVPAAQLPTKGSALDWTLGPGVQAIRDKYGADYALFVHIRDSYTTAGRVAVMILAATLHVAVAGGVQQGFATLVDLRTGKVVWFNFLSNSSGDLRTEKPAADTVTNLLKGLPL